MGILSWLIVGLIAGWLAGMVMKGSGYGVIGDIVLGIIGALVGGFLASAIFGEPDAVNGINIVSIIVAFLGAVVVVGVVRGVSRTARV
ncbi:MAG: GlsB/YeaQ/YmgE family stress response membrane protein [Chloroflexi bacterium]|nr:GlsB/YeaQ/YmgE family stress response membrane protein [Chloroflexota bacterium]